MKHIGFFQGGEFFLTEEKKPRYSNESRGYKTKGYSYKERYIHDKNCPECGGNSIYKDEWATQISYKCMKRSCRYNWFEPKVFPTKEEKELLIAEKTALENELLNETE